MKAFSARGVAVFMRDEAEYPQYGQVNDTSDRLVCLCPDGEMAKMVAAGLAAAEAVAEQFHVKADARWPKTAVVKDKL